MFKSFLNSIGYEGAGKPKARNPQEIDVDIDYPGSNFNIKFASFCFFDKTRFRMYERLASPIEAGVPIKVAISQLYQRAAFKSENGTQATVLRYLLYTINNGSPVSEGLRPFIPLNEQLLLRAGEEKGNLSAAFFRAARNIESRGKIKSEIKSALAKPMFLTIGILVLLFFIGMHVAPQLDVILPMDMWAGPARNLAITSSFVTSMWFPLFLLLCVGFMMLLLWSQKRITGKWRIYLEKIPPYSLFRVLQGASWLTTYSSMLQSGRRVESILVELIFMAERDGNKYLADRTYKIMVENAAGAENIGIAMERAGTAFPDNELIADLVMQSSLTNFDQRIEVLADRWINDSVKRVQKIARLINGITFLVLCSVITMIVMGVISLQQQIASSMGAF